MLRQLFSKKYVGKNTIKQNIQQHRYYKKIKLYNFNNQSIVFSEKKCNMQNMQKIFVKTCTVIMCIPIYFIVAFFPFTLFLFLMFIYEISGVH